VGRLEEALVAFERSLDLNDRDPISLHQYGQTLVKLDRVREGIEFYDRALEIFPEMPEALWSRGHARDRLRDWDMALEDMHRMAALDDADARPHNLIGSILLDRKGEAQRALDAFDRAIARKPDDWRYHMNRGNALLRLGRAADAAESYRKACDLRPEWGFARSRVCFALRLVGRYREALEVIEEGRELDPFDPRIHYEHAVVLGDRGRTEEALRAARTAVDLDPHFALALSWLGTLLEGAERYDQAILRFEEARAAFPPEHPLQKEITESLAECALKRDLIARLDELLGDPASVRDPVEMEVLSYLLYDRSRYRAAADFAGRLVSAEGDAPKPVHVFNASCLALLAGLGKGVDAAPDESERRRLRERARDLLARLLRLAKEGRPYADFRLAFAREDPDFGLVREEANLMSLPPDEQAAWRKLWADIEAFFASKRKGR
jgi:tetratricopeptide (TPR) repeat protein